MAKAQPPLFDQPFATAEPPDPVFCHQDFLEKLDSYRNHPIGKRASLLMQQLAIDHRRPHYKSTQGLNQGWRRSRLGGNQGSHFYAWWAPRSAAPIKAGTGFAAAPEGSVFLRDIRHHDDHSPASAQSFQDQYLPVTVPEMRAEDYGPNPWTVPQARFASARNRVRILKGFPGSGKTTALLHAADTSGAARVLYVTCSPDLAGLARRYFDRYCARDRYFYTVTFESLLRRLLGEDAPSTPLADLRRRLRGDLVPFSRSLGAWTDRTSALYDEWHAHLAGAALPIAIGRFPRCTYPRVADDNYRARRLRFLGTSALPAALDLASRLERGDSGALATRYFPELALAWRAATALTAKSGPRVPAEFLDFDCIAIDECQDLTPLEAFVLIELAAAGARRRAVPVSMFLAGDEAQTVRPSDFEWGWMNDLLHHSLGTPAEFKLSSNLRSPRGIALLVNRIWDLYAEIDKRDRPSGAGYAEIDDDATDQIFYCTAAPGEELDRLMTHLAAREGLAIVSLDESARDVLPEPVRPAVLTPSEVKGLDFHTVCVINPGRHIEAVLRGRDQYRLLSGDLESIRTRLAIDELRVALSRPTGRLIWLDISPSSTAVRTTLGFLNRDFTDRPLSPSIPAALLTAIEEEQLDLEERVQRCQADARQYLAIRPEIAWSRAQQAVSLLGDATSPAGVHDEAARHTACLTLSEICFTIAFRGLHLAPELGRPDLFSTAAANAHFAKRPGLAGVIRDIAAVMRAASIAERVPALGQLAQSFARHRAGLEPWLLTEIEPKTAAWVDELEAALAMGDNAVTLTRILPPFYEALRLPGAETRTARLVDRAVRSLMKARRFAPALDILASLPERHPELEAECLEGLGRFGPAAETWRAAGKLKEALACYRSVPDFDAAAALIREVPSHAAAPSYLWLEKLRSVVAERPQNFNRVMQASEKKVLEQMLEQALGVARKQPVARKAVARKAPAKRKKPQSGPTVPRV